VESNVGATTRGTVARGRTKRGTSVERIEQVLLVIVGALVILTVAGMWLLWPPGIAAPTDEPAPLYDARVTSVEDYECPEPDDLWMFQRTGPCQIVGFEVLDGPAEDETFTVDTGEEDYPEFSAGDRVHVGIAQAAEPGEGTFYIADFERRGSLWLLFALFFGIVVAIGRWHGLRSMIGLAISLVLIVVFVVPAILAGESPFLVAIVGAFAIMVITLYLAHGFSVKTTSALVGTAAALGFTALLAAVFVAVTNLTGYASEEATFVRFAVEGGLDLRGLILAGIVIGALGVLDDVTMSQASTVFAVHSANPEQSWSEVFTRAMSVGRDHIASVVNTLVLAYAGVSLPLLVLFTTSGLSFGEIVNTEVLAEEIVRTLVGSIGLVSAVPFTTALATVVAVRQETPTRPLPEHLRDDVDEGDLSEEEIAHRRWVEFLREGSADEVPPYLPDEDAEEELFTPDDE
jgi:uncharacterized membrane protein